MVEQTKGFPNEINKSLDELVNEDSSMKPKRFGNERGGGKEHFGGSNQGGNSQKQSQGATFQKRGGGANKDRDGDDRSGFRGGQERGGFDRDRGSGYHRRDSGRDGGKYYGRGGFNNHNDEREVNNSDYQRSMEGRRLFVSNLAFETQWKYLKDHMRQAGDVVRADIFEDQKGRSRGIGVVEFRSQGDMSKALNTLNETMLDGRKIFLKEDTQLHMLPPLMSNNRNYDNHGHQGGYNNTRRAESPGNGERKRYGGNRSRSRDRSMSEEKSQDRERRGGARKNLQDKDSANENRGLTIKKREDQRESSSERTFPVHVSNLPYSVDREQLKEAFKEFGKVLHASVSLDERGLSRGFGVVDFATKEAAESSAKTMDKASFNKREVSVRAQFTS